MISRSASPESELGDYSYSVDYEIELIDEQFYYELYDVRIFSDDKTKIITFRSYCNGKLEVKLGEEYEEVEFFEPSVKYFWMSFLEWPI